MLTGKGYAIEGVSPSPLLSIGYSVIEAMNALRPLLCSLSPSIPSPSVSLPFFFFFRWANLGDRA